MIDFIEMIKNADFIKTKFNTPRIIKKKRGGSNYFGNPFVLVNLDTGDCERFQTVQEFKKRLIQLGLGVQSNHVREILKDEKVKNHFKLFAYEWDILSWI